MSTEQDGLIPPIGRRGFLQLTAGTAARSVLPPLPVTTTATAVAGSSVAAVATTFRALSEGSLWYAGYILHRVYRKTESWESYMGKGIYASLCERGSAEEKVSAGIKRYASCNPRDLSTRLSNLFYLYAFLNDRQVRQLQDTKSWPCNQDHEWSGERYNATYKVDEDLYENGYITAAGILKAQLGAINDLLDMHELQMRSQLPLGFCHHGDLPALDMVLSLCVYSHAQSSDLSKKQIEAIKGLTSRQKIELILEFSCNPYRSAKVFSRWHWFNVPDSIPFTDMFKKGMNILPEERMMERYPDSFSVEEYRQRRDLFKCELDAFFIRRAVNKRLEMKSAVQPVSSIRPVTQTISTPPAALARGVAAVRGAFSKAGEGLTDIVHGVLRAVNQNDAVPETPPVQALENNPTQNPFDRPLSQEVNTSEATPVLRNPQP